MRKIVIYPAKILRQKTEEVEVVDKEMLREINDLKKILKNEENGAGLAAPQIGVSKRFFGGKMFDNKDISIFINPKIEKKYGEKVFPKIIGEDKREEDFLEGCLSFPKYFGTVKRFLEIDVSWNEIDSKKQLIQKKKKLVGFEAILWQHESDHLDGVVFVDHVKEDKGKFFKEINGKMEVTPVIF
ncbi:MAG: peptide deformylase [Candidatus Shapirobacteria bacterium]|nr:peptide deformylase [Candidatus Shapirobacteria bacterium]